MSPEKTTDDKSSLAPPLNLPMPTPESGKVDKEIYEAWKEHMIEGYRHNSEMFSKVLDAFMRPYWITVRMYQLLFVIGILGFILAVVFSAWKGLELGLLFGGLTVATFLTFFVSQPLRSLEQNIQFITWLGVIYNTYWTRLMYANDITKIQEDLDKITETAVNQLHQLLDTHSEVSGKRPGLQNDQPPEG